MDSVTWVRYDDNVRNHRKVESLDDATYRLWREAIEWCAQNLTDGVIRSHQLAVTSIRASRPRAAKLVQCGLWHLSGAGCRSARCPPSGRDGWVIHDYWDYQPTAEAAKEEQAKARERKRRWLEAKKNGGKNGDGNGVPDAEPDDEKNGNPAPPRPAPKGRGGPTALQRSPAADGGEVAADGEANQHQPCPICGNAMTSAYHRNACRGAA